MTAPIWQQSFPNVADWDEPLDIGTVNDLLSRTVADHAASLVFEFRGRTMSYADFGDRVDHLAAGFLSDGVTHGDSVALYLHNTLFHPLCFFALLKIGARVVHLSPLDAPRDLKQKLELAQAKRLVTTNLPIFLPHTLGLLDAGVISKLWVGDDAEWGAGLMPPMPIPVKPGVRNLAELAKAIPPQEWPDVDANDIAVLQFTGGTTGSPKAAMLSHANLTAAVSQYRHWHEHPDVVPGKMRAIGVLPLFHIYALTTVLLRHIRDGNEILLRERFDLDTVVDDITVKRASAFAGVPTMWFALLSRPGVETLDFSSLLSCVSGGAPMPFDVKTRLEAILQQPLSNGWGMTETAPAGTRVPPEVVPHPGLIGVPLPGIDMRIVALDDATKILAPGEVGEIAIRGPNVFKGYFRNQEATRESFVEGYFLTGDLGRMDERGLFDLVDRRKNMIISGGFNVYPVHIEDAIYEHESVEEVIVIGLPDAYRGQVAKAYVKLRSSHAPFTLDELQAFLSERLGRHEIPKQLEFRDTLPRSAAGKLLARVLIDELVAPITQAQPESQTS